MSDIARKVTIGDTEYTIRPFKGFKFVRAGRIVAQISNQWKAVIEALGEFTREYESLNSLRITRDMARQREVFGLTDDMFEGKEYVEVPQPPSTEEQVIGVLPKVLDMAENQVLQILALIVIEDNRLREAQTNGTVDEVLKELGGDLMFQGEMQELTELGIVAWEVVNEQFEGKGDKLRPLAEAFFKRGMQQEKKASEQSQKTSPSSLPPSLDTTAGAETPSSGTSPGLSSVPTSASSSE